MIQLDDRIKLRNTETRSLDNSLFFIRLKDIIKEHEKNTVLKRELENLKKTIEIVVDNAGDISSRIIEVLPHYTLHNDTHFYNVLAFMEQLTPESTMNRLCAVECALAILSAFTHDLSMAIGNENKEKILGQGNNKGCEEHKDFLDFCNSKKKYLEVKEHLENRLKGAATEAIKEDMMWRLEEVKQRLLGEYIRATHSHEESGYRRIRDWLCSFEKKKTISFTYNSLDLKPLLCTVDVSHGQSMNWIEEEMVKKGYRQKDVYEMQTADGTVNVAYLSWMLHLADLLDCDASRTPPVIYHHIGITDQISKEHWEKHLSIHSIKFRLNKGTRKFDLLFISHSCPSPVIHKMIHEHIKYVNCQVYEIRTAMYAAPFGNKEKYMLNLPLNAAGDIQEQRDENAVRTYIYHDIRFELDQDEIIKILMGQELYGEPGLCLRELIQNALDALQLRDLHCRIEDSESWFRPVDVLLPGEELKIKVDWGEEAGERYISITDNGTGMTKEVIEKYFTQIGKSYYNSPGYMSEREKLKELLKDSTKHNKKSTPISKFGIGILSCFMIADRIEVKTCPMQGGAQHLHVSPGLLKPYDITICGPGSLFWLKEGSRRTCGTEVKLFLKKGFVFFEEDGESLVKRLREHFYDYEYDDEFAEIPPDSVYIAYEIYKTVIWPMYPVEFKAGLPVLNGRFHFDTLLPVDANKLKEKLKEWDIPEEWAGNPGWAMADWVDDATGSRVRIAMVSPYGKDASLFDEVQQGNHLLQHEYNAFIETQLTKQNRTFLMANSMEVDDWNHFPVGSLLFSAHAGTVVWIDYRGTATPELKADRKGFTSRLPDTLKPVLEHLYKGFLDFIKNHVKNNPGLMRLFLFSINAPILRLEFSQGKIVGNRINLFRLLAENIVPGIRITETDVIKRILLLQSVFFQNHDLDHDFDHDLVLNLDRTLDRTLDRALDFALALDLDLDLARACACDRTLDFARACVRDRALDCTRVRVRTRDHTLASDLASVLDLARALDPTSSSARNIKTFSQFHTLLLTTHFFSELWQPSLEAAFPPVAPLSCRGLLSDCILDAPLTLLCQVNGSNQLVTRDTDGAESLALVFGYDLCAPLTAIPLGELRKASPQWREQRFLRALAMLPFLFLGQIQKWNEQKEELKKLGKRINRPSLFLLIPHTGLWDKPFKDWDEKDKKEKCYSALWDCSASRVVWMPGVVTREEICRKGKTVEEMLREAENEK